MMSNRLAYTDRAALGGQHVNRTISVATSVGTQARLPLFTSTFFTHSSSACPELPIFSAIDVIAAQRDGWSPR